MWPEKNPHCLRRTRCYDTNWSSFVAKSNDRSIGKGIGFSWCFWPGWSEPGNGRSSLSRKTTLLRWHRELFRVFWKRTSKAHSRKPRLSSETITLIKEMAANNRLWGAERIRGELLKL